MTRSTLRLVVLAVVLTSVVGPVGGGELRGRLFLGSDPAPGVSVLAVPYEAPLDEARREARRLPPPQPIAVVTTDPEGWFALAVPVEPGKEKLFTVQTEGGGTAAASVAGIWDAAETADLGDHALSPGGKLAGRATDAAGTPVADAGVVLLPQADPAGDPEIEAAPRFVRTGADGSFHFDVASAVGNTVTVEKAGRLIAQQTGVRAGSLGAPIVLSRGAPVSGTVRTSDGRPMAGTLVRLEGRVATRWVETGADGSFTIPNAPAGAFTAVADGGETGYVERAGVRLPLTQGTSLALVLKPPSALVGRALDAMSGRPVPRATIEVRAAGRARTTRSLPDGSYALRGLPPGSWRLRADEPRFVPWTQANVSLRAGETKKLDIPLVLGASLSGRVTAENGQPVANAKGWLSPMGRVNVQRIVRRMLGGESPVFRSRADGTFKATRLAPGQSGLLTVSHPDFQQATLGGISLAAGATKAGVTIVLKRGSTVTGVVKGGNDQPIAGAAVVLAQAFMLRGAGAGGRGSALLGMAGGGAPERGSDTTGGDGKFAVRGVAPGEYVLTVKRSGFATERVDPVKVPKSGAPAPLVVTLAPGATISGRVVRRSGSGAEGFLVRATSPGLPRFDAAATTDQATGPDGMFSLDGLKPGQSYDLQLLGPVGLGEGKHGVVAPAPNVVLTAAGPGRITGRALDAADGHPIAQFQVSYEAARGVGAFRGGPRGGALGAGGGAAGAAGQPVDVESGDGTFALDDVPAGTWSVVVTAKGYQPGRTAGVEVAEGETDDGVEVRLAAGTTVKGHVVDGTSGAPVVNASVSIDSAGAARGRGPIPAEMRSGDITTDADGRFEIEGVATGKQPLHVTHPDYADATQIVQVADEGAVVEVRMTQGGVLAGTVASDTGQPVPGANVALNQAGSGGFGFGGGAGAQMNVTDTAGQFRFDHLGAGRYTVTASLGSHTSSPVEVVLQAGQSQQDLVLQLQVGVTIQGTVSGLPTTMVTGMTVGANGPDSYVQSMRLGADGAFEFDNVPLGVVTLRGTATDPTGSTRSTTKQVTTSADQPVLTVELAFDTGFSLSGRVTQAGQPVGGAMVFASLQGGGGRQASATTDDDGSYRLNDLQEGTYAVNAMSAQAGASRRQTVALDSDQTLDIVFPSAKIAGQVVDADSKMPLANASVTIRPQDPNATGGVGQRPATTDTSGQFSFTGLDEATYTLSTSRADYQVDTRDTTATAQGTDGLVTALKRAAGIGVKVQDGLSGVPLPSVMVRVFDGQGTPVFGPTSVSLDTSGQGEIPSLPPGTYSVIAGSSGYAPVRLDGVTVPSASVMIFLTPGGTILIQAGPKTLAQGTATGTITSAAGQPALLSLFNLQGRFAISEPDLQLHNVPPGSYVLSLPTVEVSQPFAVGEGGATTVQLP